jgi:amino acid transporter
MKAEKEAQIINQKAGRIMVSRELLGASFFFAAIATFITIAIILANYTGYADSETTGAQYFLTLCCFATAIIVGFIAYKLLSRRLDKLMAKKMSLIF